MTIKGLFCVMTFSIAALLGSRLNAQVQTEVPPLISRAKPVRVERIKIHGKSLEGNLEGNAVDREVIVFLPPQLRKGEVKALPSRFMRCMVTQSALSNGVARYTYRRPLKAPSLKVLTS